MDLIPELLFWILAGLTGASAIATVVTQNIVRCATWLLFSLCGTSALFFLLGADLVGAIQLLVYVGGTMVLVVFGVMLTAQGPFIQMKSTGGEWAIAVVTGVALFGLLAHSIVVVGHSFGPPQNRAAMRDLEAKHKEGKEGDKVGDFKPLTHNITKYSFPGPDSERDPAKSKDTATLGLGFVGVGVGPVHMEGDKLIRMNYLFPFEIVSIHLLVVLIGAAYLARAKRRKGAGTP